MQIIINKLSVKYKQFKFQKVKKKCLTKKVKISLKSMFSALFFSYSLINYLFPSFLNKVKIRNEQELHLKRVDEIMYNDYLSLKNMTNDSSILSNYKNEILQILSRNAHKNITSIDKIYINYQLRFGNQLVLMNKVIFYCEIVGCKKIILGQNNNLYTRNKIIDEKYNLTIETLSSSDDCNSDTFISTYYPHPFYYFLVVRPENRLGVLKNEILKNLPFIITNTDDLYIHIRSGDIFHMPDVAVGLTQPPLCFYKTIIEQNKFKKIYIITENEYNPVTNKLVRIYDNVIYNKKNLEVDIASLAYAYNIVGSISSFYTGIIKFNDNLKNVWEYDIYKLKDQIYHLHHNINNFKRNYTIYRMSSSKIYKERMYTWRGTKGQLNIMLRDKCPKTFKVINPDN